jgi:hypothetical protein
MKCPSCGRIMVNMITFFKCSNWLCDYEEDVEPCLTPIVSEQKQPATKAYKLVAA